MMHMWMLMWMSRYNVYVNAYVDAYKDEQIWCIRGWADMMHMWRHTWMSRCVLPVVYANLSVWLFVFVDHNLPSLRTTLQKRKDNTKG
jgi:hypothetical protein